MLRKSFALLDRWLINAIKCLTGLAFAIVVVSVILGIFFRYVLKSPLSWVEEFSRLNFIWATFLGACVATRQKDHLKVTIFSEKLSPKGTAFHNIVIACFSLCFVIPILLFSPPVYEAMSMQNYAGLPFSQKWQVVPVMISMAIMAIYLVWIAVTGLRVLFQREVTT